MKKLWISLLKSVGKIPLIPFSLKLFLTQQDRRLRFLISPGKELVFDKYLGDLKVNVNTLYSIEVEMLTGAYDLKTSAIIKKFVNEDDIVIDVGANVGALTLLMAKVAYRGRVIAIEPGPPIFSRLKDNIKLNSEIDRVVEIYQLGISDYTGALFWNEDPNVAGNAGLLGSNGHSVKVETLDSIVETCALGKLDFIKIDVEGMEYEVIKGGISSIAKYQPLIYFETLDSFRKIRGFDLYGKIYEMLQAIGYQHFRVLPDGEIEKIDNLNSLRSPNTLAIPSTKF